MSGLAENRAVENWVGEKQSRLMSGFSGKQGRQKIGLAENRAVENRVSGKRGRLMSGLAGNGADRKLG